jgi:hypothetical protein
MCISMNLISYKCTCDLPRSSWFTGYICVYCGWEFDTRQDYEDAYGNLISAKGNNDNP